MIRTNPRTIPCKLYANYGVLAHEFETVYTFHAPISDIYNRVETNIPYVTGYNVTNEPILLLSGIEYLLSDVLTTRCNRPALQWFDGHRLHIRPLKIKEMRD